MVSVCIATYNGEKYIKEQLDSIINQLSDNDEIIVSDDCSTDNTLTIIRGYQDKRIKIFINNGVKGHTFNFENALKYISGDFIFFSDQDDVWLPGKVEKILRLLNIYYAVFSDAIVVDENLNPIYDSFFNERNVGRGVFKNYIKNTYFGFGMAFRKELLQYAIPFPVQNEMGHDMILGFIADMKNSIYFLNEPFTLYRRHQDTVTRMGTQKKRRNLASIVRGRILEFYYIVNIYFRIIKYK